MITAEMLTRIEENMDRISAKGIVGILMETDIYFDLSLQERYSLIKELMRKYGYPPYDGIPFSEQE